MHIDIDSKSVRVSKKPRYLELADELRAQILGGDFPDPAQFPTESILCARHKISRFTVREALRTLQEEGLIERRRGSGTMIRPASARTGTFLQTNTTISDILQHNRDSKYLITPLGKTPLPRKIAGQFGIAPSRNWLHFCGIRTRPGHNSPVAIAHSYIHESLADFVDQIQYNDTAIILQLDSLGAVKLDRVTQDIKAVPASSKIAAELNIMRRSPVLRIMRAYIGREDHLYQLSITHHPGDQFSYSLRTDIL